MKLPKLRKAADHFILRTRHSELHPIMNKLLVDLDRRTIGRLKKGIFNHTENVKLVDGYGKEIVRARFSHELVDKHGWWNKKVVVGVFRFDKGHPWCDSTDSVSRRRGWRSEQKEAETRDSTKSEIVGKTTT